MSKVAVITARGGSKRIPRKNIKLFLGKPIIAYSIEAAVNSGLFDEVMVSTDDREITEIAKAYGAKVPFYRSKETSDDYATTAMVLKEVMEEYKKRDKSFEWLCCIYPTAPFVTAEKLAACMKILQESNAAALVPVVKFSYPPQRSFICNHEGSLEYKWPENINKRSQDLESLYHDIGQFYFYHWGYQGNTIPYIVNEMEVQDIDTEDDWRMAEIKYQILNKGY